MTQNQYHVWSKQEADYLQKVTEQCKENGKINWDMVLLKYPNNTKTQLKSYFQKQIRQEKSYFKWTEVEEDQLIQAVIDNDHKWSEIKKQFPTFTQSQLTSKYHNIKNSKRYSKKLGECKTQKEKTEPKQERKCDDLISEVLRILDSIKQ